MEELSCNAVMTGPQQSHRQLWSWGDHHGHPPEVRGQAFISPTYMSWQGLSSGRARNLGEGTLPPTEVREVSHQHPAAGAMSAQSAAATPAASWSQAEPASGCPRDPWQATSPSELNFPSKMGVMLPPSQFCGEWGRDNARPQSRALITGAWWVRSLHVICVVLGSHWKALSRECAVI